MLKISDVSKTYVDGTKALKSVSLELPKGMVGLLGPNGAGKSTLMRTLACLQRPDTGHMEFEGIDLRKSPDKLRTILGYLPQYFGVYDHMSCRSLLEHMAVLKGVDKKQRNTQIPLLLELTNLKHVAGKKVAKFSGGMRQRFGIAQSLLGDPKFIIMDEPTAGLDPVERERLHDLLVKISEDRLVLLSTHIVEDIENLCRHVALLFNGEVAGDGDVRSLIAPLEGRVWQSPLESILHSGATVLSKSHRFGQSYLRVLCDFKPTENASLVEASLQDRYFYELTESRPC